MYSGEFAPWNFLYLEYVVDANGMLVIATRFKVLYESSPTFCKHWHVRWNLCWYYWNDRWIMVAGIYHSDNEIIFEMTTLHIFRYYFSFASYVNFFYWEWLPFEYCIILSVYVDVMASLLPLLVKLAFVRGVLAPLLPTCDPITATTTPQTVSTPHPYRAYVGLIFKTYTMTSSNEKTFPRYWPFVRGIHRSPVNSPHKG